LAGRRASNERFRQTAAPQPLALSWQYPVLSPMSVDGHPAINTPAFTAARKAGCLDKQAPRLEVRRCSAFKTTAASSPPSWCSSCPPTGDAHDPERHSPKRGRCRPECSHGHACGGLPLHGRSRGGPGCRHERGPGVVPSAAMVRSSVLVLDGCATLTCARGRWIIQHHADSNDGSCHGAEPLVSGGPCTCGQRGGASTEGATVRPSGCHTSRPCGSHRLWHQAGGRQSVTLPPDPSFRRTAFGNRSVCRWSVLEAQRTIATRVVKCSAADRRQSATR